MGDPCKFLENMGCFEMRITDIKVTPVAIPIKAPLRHSYGAHIFFGRTIVELHTDEGIVGLGETFGGIGQEPFDSIKNFLVGENPMHLEKIRLSISQRGYISRRPQLLSPIEFACYDIIGKYFGVPVYELLGGKVRETVPVAAYLFFSYPTEDNPEGITTPDQMVKYAIELEKVCGFKTLKLKGGVFEPDHEVEVIAALRAQFGSNYKIRIDPNAMWAPSTAIRIGEKLRPFDLEYFEDPTWGIPGLAQVSQKVNIPISTNMAVVEFEDLGPAVAMNAIQCILTDPWYWGGMHYTKILDFTAKQLGLGVGMHSGVEFGIGLSVMLHTAVTMPNLVHAIDSHYHHLTDDIIKGPMLRYEHGTMRPSDLPGLGVELDKDKVVKYHEMFLHLSQQYPEYPCDPYNPAWFPKVPSW